MPANFSRCSSKECLITGYDVVISDGVANGTIEAQLVNSCNTLHDACRAKAILMRALNDWLENEGEAAVTCLNCDCPTGGVGVTFVASSYTLVYTTTVAAPVSPVTVNVPLPFPTYNVAGTTTTP